MGRGGEYLWSPHRRTGRLAGMGIRPPDEFSAVPEPRSGFCALGVPGSDLQSRGAAYYPEPNLGIQFQRRGCFGREGTGRRGAPNIVDAVNCEGRTRAGAAFSLTLVYARTPSSASAQPRSSLLNLL